MKRLGLEALIFRHYARSALLSILTIEVFLLVMYFGINAYIGRQTEETLKREVEAVVPDLVSGSAQAINSGFAAITRQTKYFADVHRDLFSRPEEFTIPGEQPEFDKASNGSVHQTNLRDGSSLYISATGAQGPREMLLAEKTAALNPLYRHIVNDTPNVVAAYVNTPGDLNRLYPFMEKVWEQYPPDLNMEDYNFFYLADAAHNPSRGPVWTGVYLDPAGQGWMLSCIAPVYLGDSLEAVVGLDVTVEKIVGGILKMNLPWGASAFLADDKGMILAMSENVEKLLGLHELKAHVYSEAVSKEQLKPEDFNIFKMSDPKLVEGFRSLFDSKAPLQEISTRSGGLFVAQAVIPETGWRVFVVVKKSDVFESVERLATISQRIGFGAVGVMLAFYVGFFLFLRNRARRMAAEIARPVAQLTQATSELGTQGAQGVVAASGIEEIDRLTEHFNTMSGELAQRSKDLVEARVRTELKGKEAELAYTRGLYESASGYLHNVGNAITRMESRLLDFETVVKSTRQYPDVFQKIETGGPGAAETLARFKDVLLGKTVPLIESTVAGIARIKDSIRQTIAHQQAGFVAANRQPPERFDISRLLADLCAQFRGEASSLHPEIEPHVEIVGYREPLRQGMENVIKNAFEALGAPGSVTVRLAKSSGGATLRVEDTGVGITPENLPKVTTPGFTTKPGGHGLGLHSFAVFLSSCGGRLTVESDGPGKGARITAEIKNAE
jgi:signal transduction histidine kinase